MKAKAFIIDDRAEIVLQNEEKKTYKVSLDDDYTIDDFVEDIKERVGAEYDEEMEVKVYDLPKFKKRKTDALKTLTKTAVGVELDLAKAVLESRGESPLSVVPKTKVKVKTEKKPAAKKPMKKIDHPEISEEQKHRLEALEVAKRNPAYRKAKKDVGKRIKMTQKRSKNEVEGLIRGLSISKDLKRFYYVVKTDNKRIVSCAIDNETITLYA